MQAAQDVAAGSPGVSPIPEPSAGQAAVVDATVGWVEGAIAADRKVTALKQLQGHIWRAGFTKGEVRRRGCCC
jgi:methylthioribulose 1-phosphate dehydratase/enolase-phosphatase E1